jgi:WhiB family transcriptional regulator, redox-sensing transcriptional regulator
MERSHMPDSAASDSTPTRPLLIALPEVVPGFLGPWSKRAVCAGEDPSVFFPAHGDPAVRARQVCGNCPVRIDCLEYATGADEWGIWGGLDREQRRGLRDAVEDPEPLPAREAAREDNRERA